eukprot:4560949-Amphidinium_carterae.1
MGELSGCWITRSASMLVTIRPGNARQLEDALFYLRIKRSRLGILAEMIADTVVAANLTDMMADACSMRHSQRYRESDHTGVQLHLICGSKAGHCQAVALQRVGTSLSTHVYTYCLPGTT